MFWIQSIALSVCLFMTTFGLAAPGAVAETAQSGSVTVTTVGGFVAPDACQSGPAKFMVTVDETQIAEYDGWSADVTVTGPNGFYDTDFLWEDEGWNTVFFCESPNVPGTYRVNAEVEISHWRDSCEPSCSYSTYESISTTFTVTGLARTGVAFAKKAYLAHGWKFPVKVTRNGVAWPSKRVSAQVKCSGSWSNVKTLTTNQYGRVTFFVKPAAGYNSARVCGVRGDRLWYRFFVTGNWNTRDGASAQFHIVRR